MASLLYILESRHELAESSFQKMVAFFDRYSKIGTLVLPIVTQYLDFLANLIFLLNDSDSSKSLMFYMGIWKVLECIFSESVRWTKQSGQNGLIRVIMSETYILSNFLLSLCTTEFAQTLGKEREVMLSSLQVSMRANFKWFMSIDESIRNEAVEFSRNVMKASKRMKIKMDAMEKNLGQIHDLKVKTQLNEDQRKRLMDWTEEEELKLPKNIPIDYSAQQVSVPKDTQKVENPAVGSFIPANQRRIDIASKASGKFGKRMVSKLSKLQQIKADAISQARNVINIPKPVKKTVVTIPKKDDSSDEEPGRAKMVRLMDGISPERPRRQMRPIELPHVKQNPLKKLLDQEAAATVRVGDIAALHRKILQWSFPADGDKPPNLDMQLSMIPDKFDNVQQYASIFEPLLILECWEHLVKSKDEVADDDILELKIQSAVAVDGFYGKYLYS
jgi:hypothetical protein